MRLSHPSCPSRPALPLLAASVIACALVLSVSGKANAQQVYVYGPAPAPPPPRYYYYEEREAPYALALGVDIEGAIPVSVPAFLDGNNLTGGGGFKVRAGEQVRLQGGLRVTPEVGYGYEHLFASDVLGNAYDWDLHRVFAGARLSIGRFFVPVVYAHVGYGWQVTGDPNVKGAAGLSFDAGGALDLRIVPHLTVGAHIEYAAIDAQPYSLEWIALGGHANIIF
jgi:hypothetical protein